MCVGVFVLPLILFVQGENGTTAAVEEAQEGEAPAADSAVGTEEAGTVENGN